MSDITAPESEVKYEVTAAPEHGGARLDAFLAAALPHLSRSRLKRLIQAGQVRLGGKPVSEPSAKVKPGQTFAILIPESAEARPAAQAFPLAVIYEDQHLLVIDKPAGLVVHPGAGNPDRTLVNALLAHCGESLSGIGGVKRPGIVHRLDKDTSGLMVVAKTDLAHAGLARQFAEHTLERAYRALVWGVPSPRRGEIGGNIGRSPQNRKRMALLRRGGKPALTRYRVLAAYGSVASLLECRLSTGRTHQIRVHLAARGHPVMGDPLYGRASAARKAALPRAAQAALEALGRQALDAFLLAFEHPVSRKKLRFEKDIPKDINLLKKSLEELQPTVAGPC